MSRSLSCTAISLERFVNQITNFFPDQLAEARIRKEESILKYEPSYASSRKQNLYAPRFLYKLKFLLSAGTRELLQTLWPALFSIPHIAAPNQRRHKCKLLLFFQNAYRQKSFLFFFFNLKSE